MLRAAVIRYGNLDDYIQEKLTQDYFMVEANAQVTRGVKNYIKMQQTRLENVNRIRVMDVGIGVGALSSLMILNELAKASLLEKTSLILVDPSERVLEKTQTLQFQFPKLLVEQGHENLIREKIRRSKTIQACADTLHYQKSRVDLLVCHFVFSLIHPSKRSASAEKLQSLLKSNGFLGFADHHPKNHTHRLRSHQYDDIPLAHEIPLTPQAAQKLFSKIQPFDHGKTNTHHYFCGMKLFN